MGDGKDQNRQAPGVPAQDEGQEQGEGQEQDQAQE